MDVVCANKQSTSYCLCRCLYAWHPRRGRRSQGKPIHPSTKTGARARAAAWTSILPCAVAAEALWSMLARPSLSCLLLPRCPPPQKESGISPSRLLSSALRARPVLLLLLLLLLPSFIYLQDDVANNACILQVAGMQQPVPGSRPFPQCKILRYALGRSSWAAAAAATGKWTRRCRVTRRIFFPVMLLVLPSSLADVPALCVSLSLYLSACDMPLLPLRRPARARADDEGACRTRGRLKVFFGCRVMRASWSATTIAAAAGRQADEGHAGGDYQASLPRRHIPNWAAGGTRDLSLLACGECFISCTIRACTAGLGLRQVNKCPRACDIALWRPRGVLPRFPQNAESRVWCASRVSLRYTRQTASHPRVAESHLARLGLGKNTRLFVLSICVPRLGCIYEA